MSVSDYCEPCSNLLLTEAVHLLSILVAIALKNTYISLAKWVPSYFSPSLGKSSGTLSFLAPFGLFSGRNNLYFYASCKVSGNRKGRPGGRGGQEVGFASKSNPFGSGGERQYDCLVLEDVSDGASTDLDIQAMFSTHRQFEQMAFAKAVGQIIRIEIRNDHTFFFLSLQTCAERTLQNLITFQRLTKAVWTKREFQSSCQYRHFFLQSRTYPVVFPGHFYIIPYGRIKANKLWEITWLYSYKNSYGVLVKVHVRQ